MLLASILKARRDHGGFTTADQQKATTAVIPPQILQKMAKIDNNTPNYTVLRKASLG